MNGVAYDLLLIAVSAAISWFITHRYYVKSLNTQEAEYVEEKAALVAALEAHSATDAALLTQRYIDETVDAWKRKGTPVHYLDSLSDLSMEEKAEIYRAASLRHKGREPKRNPYL